MSSVIAELWSFGLCENKQGRIRRKKETELNTAENSTDLIRVNFKFLEFGHSALCICAKYS